MLFFRIKFQLPSRKRAGKCTQSRYNGASFCLKVKDKLRLNMLFACLATLLELSSLSRVQVGKNSKGADWNSLGANSIKHLILVLSGIHVGSEELVKVLFTTQIAWTLYNKGKKVSWNLCVQSLIHDHTQWEGWGEGEALSDDFLCLGLILFSCFTFGLIVIRIFTVLTTWCVNWCHLKENSVLDSKCSLCLPPSIFCLSPP